MLGIREIRRRRTTYALIALVVALIAYLVIMINGLGLGLRTGMGSALGNFDASAIAFGDETRLSVLRSELGQETVDTIATLDGVTQSAAIGYLPVDYRDSSGVIQSASFFGFDPGTIAEPDVVDGRSLSVEDEQGILVDLLFLEESGLQLGDTVNVVYRLQEVAFTIVGTVDEGSFQFNPGVFLLRESWQQLRYGPEGENPRPAASIVILQGESLVGAHGDGFEIVSKETAYASIEGLSAMDATVMSLRLFGYTIGAAVIGVFFFVLTLQKIPNIGLLKALGASNRFIVGQTLLQALVMTTVGVAISIPLAVLTSELLPQGGSERIPIALTTDTYVTTSITLIATALVAVIFSVRSILKVDPIIALAQQP